MITPTSSRPSRFAVMLVSSPVRGDLAACRAVVADSGSDYSPVVPIPEAFAGECLYTQDQWYIHDVLEIEEDRVVGVCDTATLVESPLVLAQQQWPGQPKHVPGAVMVQITGTLGNIHAVCALGLRMSEGWVGFGTHIHEARFRGLGHLGPAMRCELKVERVRRLGTGVFVTYAFDFSQEGRAIYRSRQSASWNLGAPAAGSDPRAE